MLCPLTSRGGAWGLEIQSGTGTVFVGITIAKQLLGGGLLLLSGVTWLICGEVVKDYYSLVGRSGIIGAGRGSSG